MTRSRITRRLGRSLVGAAMTLLLVAGCADQPSPADAVPRLGRTLSEVDRAIVEQRFRQARTSLNELVRATVTAREAGDLESAEADAILASAARLLSALPRRRAQEASPASPEPSTEQPEPADGGEPVPQPADEEQVEKRQEELEKRREELQKKREELQKKREELQKKREEKQKEQEGGEGDEGGGNGDGSGNGSDEGDD